MLESIQIMVDGVQQMITNVIVGGILVSSVILLLRALVRS